MDTIKGLALVATFIGVLIVFAMWVSPWAIALPSLIIDVVAVGGLSVDIIGRSAWWWC